MCVAYLSPMGWPSIYSRCSTSWTVTRIRSHWIGYFDPVKQTKSQYSAVFLTLVSIHYLYNLLFNIGIRALHVCFLVLI